MMGFDRLEFARKIGGSTCVDECKRVVTEQLKRFGYDQFDYILAPLSRSGRFDSPIELENLSDSWKEFYGSRKLFRSDPVVSRGLVCKGYLIWSELLDYRDQLKITKSEAETLHLSSDWGMGIGVSLPLRSVGSYLAGIGLVANKDWCARDHAKHFRNHYKELRELADTLHVTMHPQKHAKDALNLTTREIEVMKWISDGHRVQAIASKLGTAASTVEKQLSSARGKLGAATTAQAVARFMSLGLYEL